MEIYFIQCGNTIKIGITSDVEKRLNDLQVANPVKLKVLLTLRGTNQDERILHRRFRKYLIRGEWYKKCKALDDEIKQLKKTREIPRYDDTTIKRLDELRAIYKRNGRKASLMLPPTLYFLILESFDNKCCVCETGLTERGIKKKLFFLNLVEQPTMEDVILICNHCYYYIRSGNLSR